MEDRASIRYRVRGGHQLEGTAFVQGAKNAVLPMIAASLMAPSGQTVLRNVPMIGDVLVAVELAQAVGARVEVHADERTLVIDASELTSSVLPASLTERFRGSVLFIPPVLVRTGEVVMEGVGGCNLGRRDLDFHYRGFARLGAAIAEDENRITLRARRLEGTNLYLDMPSHTGTENLVAAAVVARGASTIENAALEPEIEDFAAFLNLMGARISGVGTGTICIEGVDHLNAVEYTVLPDRIDAATLAMAVGVTGGSADLVGAHLRHLGVVSHKLEQMGVDLEQDGAVLHVRRSRPLRPINVVTWPFPGFATDVQPQLTALACFAKGVSYVRETLFEARFAVVGELARMGAKITEEGGGLVIHGGTALQGADTWAHDLRAGMALVLAGLGAEGETVVDNAQQVERGYAGIDRRLAGLGADISREVVLGGGPGAPAAPLPAPTVEARPPVPVVGS